MSGSNFDSEIKDAMTPKSNAKGGSTKARGGNAPPPSQMKQHNSDAIAKPPPSPHQFQQPQSQAQGQAGLQQASDQFAAHMAPHAAAAPAQDGLSQAHSQIVSALAQRDMQHRKIM